MEGKEEKKSMKEREWIGYGADRLLHYLRFFKMKEDRRTLVQDDCAQALLDFVASSSTPLTKEAIDDAAELICHSFILHNVYRANPLPLLVSRRAWPLVSISHGADRLHTCIKRISDHLLLPVFQLEPLLHLDSCPFTFSPQKSATLAYPLPFLLSITSPWAAETCPCIYPLPECPPEEEGVTKPTVVKFISGTPVKDPKESKTPGKKRSVPPSVFLQDATTWKGWLKGLEIEGPVFHVDRAPPGWNSHDMAHIVFRLVPSTHDITRVKVYICDVVLVASSTSATSEEVTTPTDESMILIDEEEEKDSRSKSIFQDSESSWLQANALLLQCPLRSTWLAESKSTSTSSSSTDVVCSRSDNSFLQWSRTLSPTFSSFDDLVRSLVYGSELSLSTLLATVSMMVNATTSASRVSTLFAACFQSIDRTAQLLAITTPESSTTIADTSHGSIWYTDVPLAIDAIHHSVSILQSGASAGALGTLVLLSRLLSLETKTSISKGIYKQHPIRWLSTLEQIRGLRSKWPTFQAQWTTLTKGTSFCERFFEGIGYTTYPSFKTTFSRLLVGYYMKQTSTTTLLDISQEEFSFSPSPSPPAAS